MQKKSHGQTRWGKNSEAENKGRSTIYFSHAKKRGLGNPAPSLFPSPRPRAASETIIADKKKGGNGPLV